MATMSCSHPVQSKHTRTIGSNYSHRIDKGLANQLLETLWHKEWYLKWGWFPTPREVVVYVNKVYNC